MKELSDNVKSVEMRVYVLEKTKMGVLFCEQCDTEFPSESAFFLNHETVRKVADYLIHIIY